MFLDPFCCIVLGLASLNGDKCSKCSRAFHFYRREKNTKPLKKHPELERLLREEFRSMDDFRHAKDKLAKEAKQKNMIEGTSSSKDSETVSILNPQSSTGATSWASLVS